MAFNLLGNFALDFALKTSALTDKNFFRLTPTKNPIFTDPRIQTSKIEVLQLSENGEVYLSRLLKFESYPQLVYLPLPQGWTQQKVGLRLASAVYPAWDLALFVDDKLATLPTGLDEVALSNITEIVRTQSPSADLGQSLFFRLDLSGAFQNVATIAQVDAVHVKLDALLGQDQGDGFDYVKFIEDKYNGI